MEGLMCCFIFYSINITPMPIVFVVMYGFKDPVQCVALYFLVEEINGPFPVYLTFLLLSSSLRNLQVISCKK